MKITVINFDQMIIVDGQAERCAEVGKGFVMPDSEWAVSYDSLHGIGEVEYLDHRQNETITADQYGERYAFLEQVWADAKAVREAKEAAELAEAERIAAEHEAQQKAASL